jgi:Helix-turn-helix family
VSVKTDIEARTDALAAPAYTALIAAELAELIGLLRPIAQAVVRTGDIPLDSPMGLDLRTI